LISHHNKMSKSEGQKEHEVLQKRAIPVIF
jgi:hypothetical protein